MSRGCAATSVISPAGLILVKNLGAFYAFTRVGGRKETRKVKKEGPDPFARIEETQNALRENIRASERLLEKTQALIKQHRREVDSRP